MIKEKTMEEKFTEATLKQFKEEKKAKAIKETEISEAEKKVVEKIFKEAKMPTILYDGDVKCGEGELDIRNLSAKNRAQMSYRAEMLTLVYMRRMVDGLTDIMRILMCVLKKLGVDNINEAIDEVMTELAREVERGGKA